MRARIVTWNLQWAHGGSPRGRTIRSLLGQRSADVLVLTEAELDVVPDAGHVVDAGTDWGYRLSRPDRRKVVLWSTQPWRDIDAIGSDALPGGRWVAATTDTPVGPLRVVGVCIPWDGAHVADGRRDRVRWQDHLAYLSAFPALLAEQPRPLVVAGDFNQRIPRGRQPIAVASALERAMDGLVVCTAGDTPHGQLIDHVAHSTDLACVGMDVIPGVVDGRRLSDHHGVDVVLEAAG